MLNNLNWRLIAEITGGVLFVLLLVWYFFFHSTSTLAPTDTTQPQTGVFDSQTTTGTDTSNQGTNISEPIASPISKQKIFKMSDGPVAGAAFMEDLRPTTTVARFVMQQNGHVLDLAIDSPGSVARAASNTTIPGVVKVTWEMQTDAARQVAAGAALQYIDSGIVKTVLLNFPAASTTASSSIPAPVRIQFLPDNIAGLAASPDGKSVAYLLPGQSGVDGYIARTDGTSPKKLFSLPLSQLVLAWPSPQNMLITSKSAIGVPGIAFAVNAASGAVAPILYAAGLTTTADASFSQVIYQSAATAGRTTYSHDIKTNLDRPLSFDPIPERCVWSRAQTSVMYCAAPLSSITPNYLDLWHQGTASVADSLFSFNILTGQTSILATPGGADGGVPSDILEVSLSQDDKYLLFIKKGDRSLWGARLY